MMPLLMMMALLLLLMMPLLMMMMLLPLMMMMPLLLLMMMLLPLMPPLLLMVMMMMPLLMILVPCCCCRHLIEAYPKTKKLPAQMEFLKHLGTKVRRWLADLIKVIHPTEETPSSWKKTKSIALLKRDKPPEDPASERPVPLISTTSMLAVLVEKRRMMLVEKALSQLLRPSLCSHKPH
ncbi:unnamed protein product [Lampetra planeri]